VGFFLGQGYQGVYDLGKVLDKWLIEVSEFNKGTDIA
jgi:hypothetical protein